MVENVESKNTLKNALACSGAEINDFLCFGRILDGRIRRVQAALAIRGGYVPQMTRKYQNRE